MATGNQSNFVIYQEEFFGGFSESLEENTDIFNNASQGSIVLRPNRLKGQYNKESFMQNIAGLITSRDVTSSTAATDIAMTQDEFIGVKVHRKIGPVANTLDSWRAIGETPETMSYTLGVQVGKAAAVEMANSAVACGLGGITSLGATAVFDGQAVVTTKGTGAVNHQGLLSMLANMGDAQGSVVAWVMHSAQYFQLMGNAIADALFEVAGVTVYTGTVGSLNRPVVVVDSPSLIDGVNYSVLGLTTGAVVVDESEQQEIVSDTITGEENLKLRVQGEYAYNLNVKGMKWKLATGANPDATAVALSTNWVNVRAAANGIKGGPGVRGKFL